MSLKVLIVEDQFIEANNLQMILERAGYHVCGIARSVQIALDMIKVAMPDLVLLDIFLRGKLTGIDLAVHLQKQQIAFVYLSANSNREVLAAAKATMPYGFLVKPFREKDVLISLEVAVYLHNHNRELPLASNRVAGQQAPAIQESTQLNTGSGIDGITGNSPAIQRLSKYLRLVAPTDTSVLICGESGTGKERAANAIHQLSGRSDKPFIKINCAALPEDLAESILFGHEQGAFTGAHQRTKGKFEQADNGTLFLDEVAELSLEVQCKLLRALQEKEIERLGGSDTIKINVRVIAATNGNLIEEMAAGKFRIDLYYRLSAFPILVPPLRERQEDIAELTSVFLRQFSRRNGRSVNLVTDNAIAGLKAHAWPGNVRELEHVVERAVLLSSGNIIQNFDLQSIHTHTDTGVKTIDENEREHIRRVISLCNGKISGAGGAAALLGIPVSTLNSKMKKLGIEKIHY